VNGRTRLALASALCAATALGLVSAAAYGTGADPVKARQTAMETVGDAMKALAAIAKNEAPFDAAVVQKNAGAIADRLKTAAALFPAGSDHGDVETWAKPEIWSDRAGFESSLKAGQAAAIALVAVTQETAFRPALGELGASCKACHEMYRRPKH